MCSLLHFSEGTFTLCLSYTNRNGVLTSIELCERIHSIPLEGQWHNCTTDFTYPLRNFQFVYDLLSFFLLKQVYLFCFLLLHLHLMVWWQLLYLFDQLGRDSYRLMLA